MNTHHPRNRNTGPRGSLGGGLPRKVFRFQPPPPCLSSSCYMSCSGPALHCAAPVLETGWMQSQVRSSHTPSCPRIRLQVKPQDFLLVGYSQKLLLLVLLCWENMGLELQEEGRESAETQNLGDLIPNPESWGLCSERSMNPDPKHTSILWSFLFSA